MKDSINDILDKYYIEYYYPSYNKFIRILQHNDVKVNPEIVQEYINNKRINQLHKPFKNTKKHQNTIVSPYPFYNLQVDLTDMKNFDTTNKHNKYILFAIDIFTRYAFAYPLKNKTKTSTNQAIEHLLEDIHKKLPNNDNQPFIIATDEGKEFADFGTILKQHNMIHKTSNASISHHPLAVVDRFTRTIKNILFKYFTVNDTTNWIDVINDIVDKYNNTIHSSLFGLTPEESIRSTGYLSSKYYQTYNKYTFDINVGDHVRIKLQKKLYDKGYLRTYSLNVYTVTQRINNYYILKFVLFF